MMMSSGPALIRNFFPKAHLGRNLGLIGVAVSMGLMTGPSLGGVLIEYFSWRSIFFITAPIGLIFSLLAWHFLPSSGKRFDENFDTIGSLIWAALVTCAVLVLANPPSNWKNPIVYVTAAGGLAIFSFFIRHESTVANPLFPLRLFKRKFFSVAVICSLLSFSILFSVTLLTPFYLDRVIGLSTAHIGITMMAIPLSVLVVAPLSGYISDFIGARYLTTAGLLTSTGSLLLLTRLETTTTPLDLAWMLSILGAGQAMFLAPNSASVLANVQNNYAGVSAGLLATARNFGMLLGVAQAGMIFSFIFGKTTGGLDLSDFTKNQSHSFMTALHGAFFTAVIIGLGATFLSWMRGTELRKTRRKKEEDTLG
jgi:MFS family permease